MHRLAYCLLTLFFGSMSLLLPETKTFPLPRSILQIEAMPTPIGKKLRSRKAKMACERRQNQYASEANRPNNSESRIEFPSPVPNKANNSQAAGTSLASADGSATPLLASANPNASQASNSIKMSNLSSNKDQQVSMGNETPSSKQKNQADTSTSTLTPGTSGAAQKPVTVEIRDTTDDDESTSDDLLHGKYHAYDTVTSVHDIEQDDHIYYGQDHEGEQSSLRLGFDRKLTKILEVPSKNITRNNSMSDVNDYANSKV